MRNKKLWSSIPALDSKSGGLGLTPDRGHMLFSWATHYSHYPSQAPVVQIVDSAIYWINLFPGVCFSNCRKRFGPIAAGKVSLFTLKKEVSVVLPINIIKLSVNKTKRTGLLGSIAIFVHCFPNQSREVFRELPRRRFVRYDPRFYHLDFDLNFGPKGYRDFRERAPGPSCSKVG